MRVSDYVKRKNRARGLRSRDSGRILFRRMATALANVRRDKPLPSNQRWTAIVYPGMRTINTSTGEDTTTPPRFELCIEYLCEDGIWSC